MEQILQYLAAGGDVGVWVLAYGFWRFDRRFIRLEMKVFPDAFTR